MVEYTSQCLFPKCGKTFTSERKRKYCSIKCRTRHSAQRRYKKIKNNESFIQERNKKNKQYYESHRDELKERMKIYGHNYYQKKKQKKDEEEKQKINKP